MVGAAVDADDLIRQASRATTPTSSSPTSRCRRTLRRRAARGDQIRERRPETGVIVLSQFLEDRYALDLVGDRAEGVGYLLKDRVGDLTRFLDAVQRVAAGGSALDPDVVQRMVGRRRHHSKLDDLTPRERQVLALMAQGRSNTASRTSSPSRWRPWSAT